METHDGRDASRGRPIKSASIILLWASISAFMLAGSAEAQQRCMTVPAPGTDWRDCNKSNIMLRDGNLEGAILIGTNFGATDLRETNLNSANFEQANLVRASLAGATAQKANFAKVEGYRASFMGASAEGASFASAELQRADFSKAHLTGANFEKAELGRANFDKAVLTGTRFPLANLARANLSGAIFEAPIDFSRTFMFLTRIEGLDLSGAVGLEQAQIDIACGDDATKLPAGLAKPGNWPCQFN